MKPHSHRGFTCKPPVHPTLRRLYVLPGSLPSRQLLPGNHVLRYISANKRRSISLSASQRHNPAENSDCSGKFNQSASTGRRDVLVTSFLAMGAYFLRSAVARADDKAPESAAAPTPKVTVTDTPPAAKIEEKSEEVISSRIYDATVIGEPMAVGKDKRKVWEKLINARVVYLGEAEQVPIRDDKELELEIVKKTRKLCLEAERTLSLALEAFPSNLQEQLNQYLDKRFNSTANTTI